VCFDELRRDEISEIKRENEQKVKIWTENEVAGTWNTNKSKQKDGKKEEDNQSLAYLQHCNVVEHKHRRVSCRQL
jgi:hypothetical protein